MGDFQLEELQPAIFDKRLKQQFALELGDRWLTEEMEAKPEKTVGSIGVTSATGQGVKRCRKRITV